MVAINGNYYNINVQLYFTYTFIPIGEQRHYSQYDVLCANEPEKLCWVDCTFDASDNKQWHESGVNGNGMCLGLPRKWTAVEVAQDGTSNPVSYSIHRQFY